MSINSNPDIQIQLNETINEILNSQDVLFQGGYLVFETGDNFTFTSDDPNNQFGKTSVDLIPTSYGSYIGKVMPTQLVYDEEGTITLQFALPRNDKFVAGYQRIVKFKKDIRGLAGTFKVDELDDQQQVIEVDYNYIIHSSPVNQEQSPITLNGVKVVIVNMTVYYKVFTSRSANNNKYRIKELDANDDTYIELPEKARNMNVGSNEQPSQDVLSSESVSSKGATIWSKTLSMYDTDNIFTDYLYTIQEGTSALKPKIFDLEMTLGGRPPVIRKAIVTQLTYDDTLGKDITWSLTFRKPIQFPEV